MHIICTGSPHLFHKCHILKLFIMIVEFVAFFSQEELKKKKKLTERSPKILLGASRYSAKIFF